MLTPRQQNAYHRARTLITGDRLAEAASMLVDIASPTGAEGPLARAVVDRLTGLGIDAQEQALDARQSNAFAILRGTGARASLMLSAPTDTVTSNSADEDTPWAAAGEIGRTHVGTPDPNTPLVGRLLLDKKKK